jgi:hypothetical protein
MNRPRNETKCCDCGKPAMPKKIDGDWVCEECNKIKVSEEDHGPKRESK